MDCTEQQDCGCLSECCGICSLAEKASRPRLDANNAADWPPLNLNKLKGEKHRELREADSGEPMLWFWQMEGQRWNLDTTSFDTAKKAWRRLAATDEERHAESTKRHVRAVTLPEREAEAEANEAQEEESARVQEVNARRWRALRALLRRCGLERLSPGFEQLRDDGGFDSLYELPTSSRLGWLMHCRRFSTASEEFH